jgi:putative ribosome biogenesis GTPase RsgA
MKHIKNFEKNDYQFNVGDYVRIKDSDEIGIIVSIMKDKKLFSISIIQQSYMVEIKGTLSVYIANELKRLTPEEKELYINTKKYNI